MASVESRGYRVRVSYPIIFEYRYAVYPNERDWRVSDRPKATIFQSETEAAEAAKAINDDTDIKAVQGAASVEPVPSFDPDWCMHPGVHLKEHMLHMNLSEAEMSQKIGIPIETLKGLLRGEEIIGSQMAERLAVATGRPAENWFNLETNFREGLRKGLTWTKDT